MELTHFNKKQALIDALVDLDERWYRYMRFNKVTQSYHYKKKQHDLLRDKYFQALDYLDDLLTFLKDTEGLWEAMTI